MNTNIANQDHPELDSPLESAVWAVLDEPVPADAIERVKQRARDVAANDNETNADPVAKETNLHDPPASRWRKLRLVAQLAIAVSLMMVALLTLFGSNESLAQVIEATLSRRWIHSVSTYYPNDASSSPKSTGDPGSRLVVEHWYSQVLGILAAKLPGTIYFTDRKTGFSVTYDVGSDTVKKTLPTPLETNPIEFSGNPLEQLQMIASSEETGRYQVTGLTTKTATVDGRSVTKATFDLAERGIPLSRRSCVIVIDRDSELLASLTEDFASGLRRETVFDYPKTGPTDMMHAGIPESATVIDRRASTDVTRLESKWTEARVNFDDYDAIVVQVPHGLEHSLVTGLNTNINRVRRSGNQYRVDVLLSVKEQIEPPADDSDVDQWWKEQRDRYWSVPMLICDGQTVTYYTMIDGNIETGVQPNLEVTVKNHHSVHGIGIDRPVAWPHLMPEYASRPYLSLADPSRRFTYSATPDDGPDDTVRVVVTTPDATTKNIHHYWLDPNVGLCVRRSVQPVFHSKASAPDKAGCVAYVETVDVMEYKQSPGGYWFPTTIERETSESSRKRVQTFHVDFNVNFDNMLFRPLDLPK